MTNILSNTPIEPEPKNKLRLLFDRINLRTKIIVATMFVTTLTIVGMASYIAYRAQQTNNYLTEQLDTSVRQEASAVLQEVSNKQVDALNNFFVALNKDISDFGSSTGKILSEQSTLNDGLYWDATESLQRLDNGSWDNPDTDQVSIFIPAKVELTPFLTSKLNTLIKTEFIAPVILDSNPDTIAVYFGGTSGETFYYPNINLATLVPEDFDVTQRPWYVNASPEQNSDRATLWSEPYLDAAANGLVITTSTPVFDSSDNFRGVVAMDIQLNRITEIVSSIEVGETGSAFLLDESNRIIAMPPTIYEKFRLDPEEYPLGNILEEASLSETTSTDLWSVLTKMSNGESGLETISVSDTDNYIIYQSIPEVGYSLAIIVPSEELLTGYALAQEQISASTRNTLLLGGLLVIVLLLASLGASLMIGNVLIRPLSALTAAASEVSQGNLSAKAEVISQDEIGQLAITFNSMVDNIQESVTTLEDRVTARTKDQTVVAEITTEIAQIQDVQEMLTRLVHLTQRGFDLYHAHVFTFSEQDTGEELRIVACGYREGEEHKGTHGTTTIAYDRPDSIVARCARGQKPIIVNDVRSSRAWLPNPQLPETRSEMAIPMLVGGKLLGVLDVQSESKGRFSKDDAQIHTTLASQTAVAMQNLLQYEESVKMANDLSVVTEVGIATATFTETGKLLQEIVDLSKKSFQLYHAHIYLMNETGDTLALASGAGEIGRKMVSNNLSIALDREQSLVARAARTKQGVVVNNVTEDPNFLPNPLLPETRSEMAVPMIIGERVIGVLDVQSDKIDRFSGLDVNIMTTLASQVAVALQNTRSFEEAQNQADRETTLNLITQKIQQTGTIEDALKITARELGNALGKRKTIVSIDPKSLRLSDKEEESKKGGDRQNAAETSEIAEAGVE